MNIINFNKMDISTTKLELIAMIIGTKDDFVLERVRTILEKQDPKIVGYSVVGEPLSEELYNQKLQRAEENYKLGNFISHEDLKKKYNIGNE